MGVGAALYGREVFVEREDGGVGGLEEGEEGVLFLEDEPGALDGRGDTVFSPVFSDTTMERGQWVLDVIVFASVARVNSVAWSGRGTSGAEKRSVQRPFGGDGMQGVAEEGQLFGRRWTSGRWGCAVRREDGLVGCCRADAGRHEVGSSMHGEQILVESDKYEFRGEEATKRWVIRQRQKEKLAKS